MRILTIVALFCFVAVISAKKHHASENENIVETESKAHSAKKYSKEHQKSHHHTHKHKKQHVDELMNEPEPKQAPVEVPEPEIELQENIETSKNAVYDERHNEQMKDLHLQDLSYEENLKKEKKKGHHGAHRAEILNDEKEERKLFADKESKHEVDEKIIEDSFEPLETTEKGKKNKKDKKSKDKSKNKKKAYEKNKEKNNKKSKDGKKNKDKKNKKDKKKH